MRRQGAVIATIVACLAAGGSARADLIHAGLAGGGMTVSFTPERDGRTLLVSGRPLSVTLQYHQRTAAEGVAFSGQGWVTAGAAGRRCAATPGRDGGRTILRAPYSQGADGDLLFFANAVTMPAGPVRLCAWARIGDGPLRGPVAVDRTFVPALFGALWIREPDINDWTSHVTAAWSSDPLRRTDSDEQPGRAGCTRDVRSEDADQTNGLYSFRIFTGTGKAPRDCSLIENTYAVTSGPRAGESATYGVRLPDAGPAWDVLAHHGDCLPYEELLKAGLPTIRAVLPKLGCRVGRVLHARKPYSNAATGRPWAFAYGGADADILPAGSPVDVVIDAEPGKAAPAPPVPKAPKEPKPAIHHGYGGPPKAVKQAGCAHEVKAGPIDALAACWVRRGERSVSAGRVRLNGIDMTPAHAGVEISVNRRSFAVSSDGPVELRVGDLSLSRDRLDWKRPDRVFEIKGKAKDFSTQNQHVFGLPVDGSVSLQLADGRTRLKVTVKVPDEKPLRALKHLAGWSGELSAAATNPEGLTLDGAKLSFPGLQFGFVEVQDVELAVSLGDKKDAYHFDGGATIYPFRVSRIGIDGRVGFGPKDGYAKLELAVENLNRMLVYGFFLQRLGLGLQINPFQVSGSIGATFGPQFRIEHKLISAARIDGGLSYDGDKLVATGALEIAEARSGDAKVTVGGDALVSAEGTLKLEVGGYGLEGKMSGWFDGVRSFNVEGSAALSLPGPDGKGEAVLSSRGAGACRHGFGPDFGFGYEWGKGLGGISFLATGCNLGRWRALAAAAQAGAPRTVTVRKGLRQLAIRVTGVGGPPEVAFVAPSGRRIEGAELLDATTLLARDPDTSATYLLVDHPEPGTWRIEPPAAGPAIAAVSSAAPLPRLRLRATVLGHGSRRTLRYRAAGLAGRRVTFVDAAGSARRIIGRARGGRGRIAFRPVPGPRRHRILALVEQGAIPAGPPRLVAHFHAVAPRPARPRRLRVARRGAGVLVRWSARRGVRHELVARLSDGQRIRRVVPPGRGRARLYVVPRTVRGTITLVARSGDGVASRPARVRLRARRR